MKIDHELTYNLRLKHFYCVNNYKYGSGAKLRCYVTEV